MIDQQIKNDVPNVVPKEHTNLIEYAFGSAVMLACIWFPWNYVSEYWFPTLAPQYQHPSYWMIYWLAFTLWCCVEICIIVFQDYKKRLKE